MTWWKQRGLRFKVALVVSLTLLIVLGLAFYGASRYILAQLWQQETQAAENLNAIATSILDDAMMAGRKDTIQNALDTLGYAVGGHIDSIAVYDDQSVLTSFATGFPGGRTISQENLATDIHDPGCWVCHQLPPEERPTMTVVNLEGKDVLRSVVPLYNEPRCQTCHGTGLPVLGDSILDVRLDRYQETVSNVRLGFGVGILIVVIFVASVIYFLLRNIVIKPLEEVINITESVVQGNLNQEVQIRSEDEIGQLGKAFNSMTRQLRNLLENLESQIANRTFALEQRSTYLETSAKVGQVAANILDPDILVQQVVDLIKDSFNFYYVGLFLADPTNAWAELRAGTGEAGRIMLEQKHRLKIGQESMVGWCMANSKARIALDVGEDAVRFENPHLPMTRSECALPLRSRGQTVGAFTIQSSEASAFDQDIITALQTMADQVAVALDNARLFSKSEAALEASQRAFGQVSQEAWNRYLSTTSDFDILATSQSEIRVQRDDWSPEMIETLQVGEITRHNDGAVHIPIISRDQILGVVRFQKREGSQDWSNEEIELMDTLVDQLETALETARLYSDTQRQAARVRLTQDVTDKLHRSLDMDALMQTLLQEISTALGASGAFVQLSAPSTASDPASDPKIKAR